MANAPSVRELVEAATGTSLENGFYDQSNPNYERNQQILAEAISALYGDVGANLDTRDWGAIMASSNPLQAAKDGLKAMYSDKAYLQKNAEHVLAQGYLPEQADYTYQQLAGRVGSTYDPNWSAGSRFAGAYDTQGYLNQLNQLNGNPAGVAAFESSKWSRWGGNPRGTVGSTGVVDNAGTGSSTNTGVTGGSTTNTGTTSPGTVVPGGTAAGGATGTGGVVYGPDGRSYSSAAAAIAAGVTNFSYTKPNFATPGTNTQPGLIDDARSLTQLAAVPNAVTGNVNNSGLITGANSQLFNTGSPRIKLPGAMTNPFNV